MKIIYNIGSIALIGICVFAGFNDRMLLAVLYFFASVAFLFAANIDKFYKEKAPKASLESEARDLIEKADVTICEMQNLAKLVTRTALSLIKRSGRFEAYPEEEQEAIKVSFLRLLSNLDLTEKDREEVLEEYNKFIEIDYVFMLLESRIPLKWPREALQRRRELLSNAVATCPAPEQVEELLIANNSLSKNHQEILEDFKYFRKYKKYRRPEMIAKYKDLRKTMNL